ncbi:uncharacterized protein LOC113847108 isoform X2 [Abrus precatorius]|uniref:Uncharacterized protein LOC113847108 isoform X2 n=1 Tax=Abrus precatorius TaxID=3816 RepID=A0A8B8JJY9_ABRPR|nr:uncharacterized protein LOC113847108 isoform X2 [Abrus precatorius]
MARFVLSPRVLMIYMHLFSTEVKGIQATILNLPYKGLCHRFNQEREGRREGGEARLQMNVLLERAIFCFSKMVLWNECTGDQMCLGIYANGNLSVLLQNHNGRVHVKHDTKW